MTSDNIAYPPAGIFTLPIQIVSSRFKPEHSFSVIALPSGSPGRWWQRLKLVLA